MTHVQPPTPSHIHSNVMPKSTSPNQSNVKNINMTTGGYNSGSSPVFTELPQWIVLDNTKEDSDREEQDSMLAARASSVWPDLVDLATATESTVPSSLTPVLSESAYHYQSPQSSPSATPPPDSDEPQQRSTKQHRPVFVVIPKRVSHTLKKDPTVSTTSSSGRTSAREENGIVTNSSLASALTLSFAQNGSESFRTLEPLQTSHVNEYYNQPSLISKPPRPDYYRKATSFRSQLHPKKDLDFYLGTAEAQLTYPASSDTSPKSFPSDPRLPRNHNWKSADGDDNWEAQKSGYISEDFGRVAGFLERLEVCFGPGDTRRGSGRKPKPILNATTFPDDLAILLESSSEERESAENAVDRSLNGLGKRKRDESEDEVENQISETPAYNVVPVSVAISWAQIIQKLTKGKVTVSNEDLDKIYETLVEIKTAPLSADVLKESGLAQRLLQLAEMNDVPSVGRNLRRKAKKLVVKWKIVDESSVGGRSIDNCGL